MVIASTTNQVEELVCCWREFSGWYGCTRGWVCRDTSHAETFVTDDSMRVLIGTNLVTEGFDIKKLMMVLPLDNRLNTVELIQGVGRIIGRGLFYLLSRKNNWAARNRRGEFSPIKEGCISEQVREFYGLESKKGNKGQHVG